MKNPMKILSLSKDQVLDEKNGVSWQTSYEAFGSATVITSVVEQNHRFPGQYYDVESGLHYNWHRYYEPRTGRYVTSDPIGLQGGLNTFAYVSSNPTGWYDSTGLLSTTKAYWHYFTGGGSSLTTDFSKVGSGIGLDDFSHYSLARDAYIAKASPNGTSPENFSQRESIDVGGAVFGRVWFNLKGEFTSSCSAWKFEGEVSAEDDIFDFQEAPWGERDRWKEIVTRIIGAVPIGTPFTIHIKGSKTVSDGGNL